LAIDISRLGPAAQKQVREKLAAAKKAKQEAGAANPSPAQEKRTNKLNAKKTDGTTAKKKRNGRRSFAGWKRPGKSGI
jgi:hypothetical protein